MFVKLGAQTIERAAELGVESVVGIANANSTPGFLRRLDFELVTSLPANVMLPLPGSSAGITSHDAEAGEPQRGLDQVESLLGVPARGEGRRWTVETLRWRLRRPGASYSLHRSPRLLAVTCAERRGGVRFAIVLRSSPRPRCPGPRRGRS